MSQQVCLPDFCMTFSSVMSSGIAAPASLFPLPRTDSILRVGESCAFLTGYTLDTLVLGGSGLITLLLKVSVDTAAAVAEGHGILDVGSGKIFSGLAFLQLRCISLRKRSQKNVS